MMDFKQQFDRLYPLLASEVKTAAPSLAKVVSYALQLLFCIVAITVVLTWQMLLRLGDEIEKMQKKDVEERKKNPQKKREEKQMVLDVKKW